MEIIYHNRPDQCQIVTKIAYPYEDQPYFSEKDWVCDEDQFFSVKFYLKQK